MIGLIIGISNNYVRRDNFYIDSEANKTQDTLCLFHNCPIKRSICHYFDTNNRNILQFNNFVKNASIVFDYNNEEQDQIQKEERMVDVCQLEEMVEDSDCLIKFFLPHFESVMEMITKNIFIQPNVCNTAQDISLANTTFETNNIVNDQDPTWPHIKGIFNIFHKLVNNSFFVLKVQDYISKDFIKNVKFILNQRL